jgi:hypothetical protein
MTDEQSNMPAEPSKPSKLAKVRLAVTSFFQSREGRPWYTDMQKLSILLGGVLVVLIVGMGVYVGLSPAQKPLIADDQHFGELPENDEKEEEVPVGTLSGLPCEYYDRRPIAVMLAGDPINRPVSGFAKADMVFELPVLTSGVTRLAAVYQCGQPEDIGSVRSARHDYLFLVTGVDAILAHWGGSYHALNRIRAGEFQTISALANPHNAFFRKHHLPAPYNGFTTYERLWNALEQLGHRTTTEFEGYEFKDDASEEERPEGGRLTIHWPGQFRVHYEYDPETNRYRRFWGGTLQVDGEDNSTVVAPSVVAIMRAQNRMAPGPGGYNDVAVEGEGALELYQDGQRITGTWHKDPRHKSDPVHFLDEEGNPIVLTRGQVWIMAVDPSISVTWE